MIIFTLRRRLILLLTQSEPILMRSAVRASVCVCVFAAKLMWIHCHALTPRRGRGARWGSNTEPGLAVQSSATRSIDRAVRSDYKCTDTHINTHTRWSTQRYNGLLPASSYIYSSHRIVPWKFYILVALFSVPPPPWEGGISVAFVRPSVRLHVRRVHSK